MQINAIPMREFKSWMYVPSLYYALVNTLCNLKQEQLGTCMHNMQALLHYKCTMTTLAMLMEALCGLA